MLKKRAMQINEEILAVWNKIQKVRDAGRRANLKTKLRALHRKQSEIMNRKPPPTIYYVNKNVGVHGGVLNNKVRKS